MRCHCHIRFRSRVCPTASLPPQILERDVLDVLSEDRYAPLYGTLPPDRPRSHWPHAVASPHAAVCLHARTPPSEYYHPKFAGVVVRPKLSFDDFRGGGSAIFPPFCHRSMVYQAEKWRSNILRHHSKFGSAAPSPSTFPPTFLPRARNGDPGPGRREVVGQRIPVLCAGTRGPRRTGGHCPRSPPPCPAASVWGPPGGGGGLPVRRCVGTVDSVGPFLLCWF